MEPGSFVMASSWKYTRRNTVALSPPPSDKPPTVFSISLRRALSSFMAASVSGISTGNR